MSQGLPPHVTKPSDAMLEMLKAPAGMQGSDEEGESAALFQSLKGPIAPDDIWIKLSLTVNALSQPSCLLWHAVACPCNALKPFNLCRRMHVQVCPGGPDGQPVGLQIKDCGVCQFCADKPRFGGKGTKRQKCINKKKPSIGPVKAWASLRITSKQHELLIEKYANREVSTALIYNTAVLLTCSPRDTARVASFLCAIPCALPMIYT
jgi:hypothetical protein